MEYEFKLPDIGEGLTEGEVVKWLVKEGAPIAENQPLVSVLTDKAEVEIPSPKTGKVLKLLAKEGQKVPVHGPLVLFEVGAAQPAGAKTAPAAAPQAKAAGQAAPAAPKADAAGAAQALPTVRRLASELGMDLGSLRGTGPGGRITEADVRAAGSKAPAPGAPSGTDERVPFIGIRRRTAEKMAQAKRAIPHVTHVDEADVTALVALREELKPQAAAKDVKLTYLAFVLRALAKALRRFPDLNSTLDEAGGAILRKAAIHVGIAAATPQGLVVPVIKDVHTKDLWTLAADIQRLAEGARANTLAAADLQGGTFTVTNVGPIGGLFATPIINFPEVGILAVMKVQKRPVVRDGVVQVRDMVNLALSFDHRVLDGAQAAEFMNALISHLENPRTLL